MSHMTIEFRCKEWCKHCGENYEGCPICELAHPLSDMFDSMRRAYKHCAMAIVLSDASNPDRIVMDRVLYENAIHLIRAVDEVIAKIE